jgi:hypothetical protein
MKVKYIEEHIPRWFIFGEHPTTGHVDISDGDGDVLVDIPRQLAEEVIAARSRFVDERVAYWLAHLEEFYEATKKR